MLQTHCWILKIKEDNALAFLAIGTRRNDHVFTF